MHIYKNISTPIYLQLKQKLIKNIRVGDLMPNSMIPSEIQLAKELGVSRMTVNKTLNELVREGYLFRQQGKGTYVAERRLDYGFFRITSFHRDMKERGLIPGTNVLRNEVILAPREAKEALQLHNQEKVILVMRLRFADGKPLMLERRYLNLSLCRPILNEALDKESIHDLLVRKYNLPLTRVRQYLEAVALRADEARLLKVKVNSPALLLHRITFTKEQPVTLVRYLYRGDRYRFHAEFRPEE